MDYEIDRLYRSVKCIVTAVLLLAKDSVQVQISRTVTINLYKDKNLWNIFMSGVRNGTCHFPET